MGLDGQPCATDACPDYVTRLNQCLCQSCCADVNFALVNHIVQLSGVEACSDVTCAASKFSAMLEFAGLSMSDFAAMESRRAVGLTPREFEMVLQRLLQLDPATSSLRMGAPSPGSTPDSVAMMATLSCADPVECDAAWSRFYKSICSGYLAGNLTEAFGMPVEMDPVANGCNITNTTTALAPALAAQAATTSAVVTAVVAASVAGSVAGIVLLD